MSCFSDASPLIILADVDRFGLLAEVFDEIVIAEAVRQEVAGGEEERVGATAVSSAVAEGFVRVRQADVDEAHELRSLYRLGKGEAATIALAVVCVRVSGSPVQV